MTITVHVPDSLLEDLGETPEELRREILRVAAIHLYSRGLVSQGKGARDRRSESLGVHPGSWTRRGSRLPGDFGGTGGGGGACLRGTSSTPRRSSF